MNYLYLNGELADISPGTVIALTFQQYNPINPGQIGVTYSNRFNLPLTNTNRGLIGLSDSLESTSQALKSIISARYIQDGAEIIPSGSLKVVEINEESIECVLFADLDFYSTIKDRTLNDLDYTDINPIINGSGSAESDLIYDLREQAKVFIGGSGEVFSALVDLGNTIIDNGGQIEAVTYDITVNPGTPNMFLPLFFGYKQILQRVVTDAGYNYNWGDVETDSLTFNTLAVMQAGYSGEIRLQYSDSFRDDVEFSALVDADETFTDIGNGATRVLFFKNEVKRSDFYFPDATGSARSRYVPTNPDTTNEYFTMSFTYKGYVNKASGSGDIAFYKNGTKQTNLSGVAGVNYQVLSSGVNYVDISYSCNLADADIIEVRFVQTAVNPCEVTYYDGGEFAGTCLGVNESLGLAPTVYLNQILPSVNQLDMWKDMLFRFGQIPKFSNGTVYLKALKDILDDVAGVIDWTEKRDKTFHSHEIHLDLAQVNFVRYEVSNDLNEGFRQGTFEINDTTLEEEAVLWTSPFTPSLDIPKEGIFCGRMMAQNDYADGDFTRWSIDTGARLFLIRENYGNEPSVVLSVFPNDTPVTTYAVACGSRVATSQFDRSIGLDLVLREWYTSDGEFTTGFLNRLKDAKWVTRRYNLSSVDVMNLDPHKMIHDDGVYFLFPKVKSLVPGKITEVEMLKI